MKSEISGKKFRRNQKYNGLYIMLIIIGGIGLIVSFVTVNSVSNSGIILIIGLLQILTKDKSVLQFHDDHFEYKPAPIASLKLIKYTDLMEVKKEEKKIMLHITDMKKPITLPTGAFNAHEFVEITECFEQIAAKQSI